MARYHNYEFASAAYQIGIVLASAAVITGMMVLAYRAAGLGIIGLIFTGLDCSRRTLPHQIMAMFMGGGGH